MRRNPTAKTRAPKAVWSVEPLPPYARASGVAGLLLIVEVATRRIAALETELRRLQNAPERSIR